WPIHGRMGKAPGISGEVRLGIDGDHFDTVVQDGLLQGEVSIELAPADFKAMLIPREGRRRWPSVIEELRRMANRGVEIRLLHAGVPSAAALLELAGGLPANVTIRRCPRLHAKAVIVDASATYLGSADL